MPTGVRCPYCQADILVRADGVRCVKCATAHHLACWTQQGKCAIAGCGCPASRKMTKLATARVALGVGRAIFAEAMETARERLGGKSTIGLFVVSCLVTGLGVAPVLYATHASRKVDLEVVLGGVFLILSAWIAALLYRGADLSDDLTMRPLEKGPNEYFQPIWGSLGGGSGGGSGGSSSGCNGSGCDAAGDLEGVAVIIVALVALVFLVCVVLPIIAFVSLEIVFPVIVVGTYGTLYWALAFAVNGNEGLKGRLVACVVRALVFSALYTAMVAGLLVAGIKLFHMYKPPVPA